MENKQVYHTTSPPPGRRPPTKVHHHHQHHNNNNNEIYQQQYGANPKYYQGDQYPSYNQGLQAGGGDSVANQNNYQQHQQYLGGGNIGGGNSGGGGQQQQQHFNSNNYQQQQYLGGGNSVVGGNSVGGEQHHQHQQQHFNSLPIQRKGPDSQSGYYSLRNPHHHQVSSLNPPFPTTDITFSTPSPPTASVANRSPASPSAVVPAAVPAGVPTAYQGRNQGRVTNQQKLQPPGAELLGGLGEVGGGPSERQVGTVTAGTTAGRSGRGEVLGGRGEGVEKGGLFTYPPRHELKQYDLSDNVPDSGLKGQVHSLDRYNYQQKPQNLVNPQQYTGQSYVQDSFSNSLPRVSGHSQFSPTYQQNLQGGGATGAGVGFQIPAESSPRHPASPVYTKSNFQGGGTGFQIPAESPPRHPTTPVYTKQDPTGRFPPHQQQPPKPLLQAQQNGGGSAFHKYTDNHGYAPSVQTNASLRAEQPHSSPSHTTAGSQRYPAQQLDNIGISGTSGSTGSGSAGDNARRSTSGFNTTTTTTPTTGYDETPRNHPISYNDSVIGGQYQNQQQLPYIVNNSNNIAKRGALRRSHSIGSGDRAWDSVNGTDRRRITSPVSVKVGGQGSSVSADSNFTFPRANSVGGSSSRPTTPSSSLSPASGIFINSYNHHPHPHHNQQQHQHHAPVIHDFHEFPPHSPFSNNSHHNISGDSISLASPVPSIGSTTTTGSVGSNNSGSGQVLPFSSELSPQKPSGDVSFDNWAFGSFRNNMMANAGDQMRAMEENMRRMQKHMEEQFKSFNMSHPSSISPPEGFPPLMDPSKMMPPPPTMAIKGMGEPLVPGVQTAVPSFASNPSVFASIPGGPQQQQQQQQLQHHQHQQQPHQSLSIQSTPSSTMTSSSSRPVTSSGLPVTRGSFHPGVDTMELNRCIQDTPDGKKQLQLKFDMQDFKPEEVSVKKDKNKLEVHAHHEEKEPNRVACKVFHQQYHLPKNVRLAKMEYAMDPEGTLTVRSPVKPRHNVKWEEGQKLEQTKLIHPQQ